MNLLKKMIVFTILLLILLPTSLCVILFFKVADLKTQIQEIKTIAVSANGGNGNSGQGDKSTNNNNEADTEETSKSVEETSVKEEPSDVNNVHYSETEQVAQAVEDGRKVVYLTFDDGPCDSTDALLDVLDHYDVKATFFVIGNQTGYEDELIRIVDEGHTLGMHSYTHDYSLLYADVDSFANEITMEEKYLYETTGIMPTLFRFPGGSSNSQTPHTISTFIEYLNQQDLTYFDWNVSSGDSGASLTVNDIYNNVMNGIAKNDVSVVLMHDSVDKKNTFKAVPKIIETLQAMDALILPITAETVPVHHNVN